MRETNAAVIGGDDPEARRHDPSRAGGLFDALGGPSFDRLTRLASRVLDAPVALVSLVDKDRQYFTSCVGLPEPWATGRQTPLLHSFCRHVVVDRTPLVVNDARDHPLVRDNPAIRDLGVAAYLGVPLITPDGEVIGSFCAIDRRPHAWSEADLETMSDLAESVMTEIAIRQQTEALHDADRRKNEFMAMLAHELRNPLGAIRNAVEVARTGDPKDVAWGMDVIGRQTRNFSHLIDDLLDVSRVAQGKLQIHPARVDPATALRHAAQAVRPLVEEKSHRLTVDVDGGAGLWLDADPVRLEQMLVNVLTNAAKYTPRGGRIDASVGSADSQVVYRVRDNGVGIPAEQLPKMFELFAQSDRSLSRAEGGLGIGLSLVRSLAEAHGGVVTASSAGTGLGSEFVIRLPAATPPDPADDAVAATAVPTTPGPRRTPVSGRRVLVVEDNVDTARGMAKLLGLAGHEVRLAPDGAAALASARAFRPGVILLDIGLPGMDGYEVAARLRLDESGRRAVLIAVSGYGDDPARARSLAAGFDHHLTKPIDLDTLIALLNVPAAGPEAGA